MKLLKGLGSCTVLALFLGLVVLSSGAGAAEDRTAAVSKRMEESLGLPLLTGNVWQTMTPDCKVAFIWGFGHVVTIERELAVKFPELEDQDFSRKAAEGMGGMPMNDIVATIDNYYKTHPDQLDIPVVRVIWDTMIKPKITTGIAGQPLKP
jgi:hypothetical protein